MLNVIQIRLNYVGNIKTEMHMMRVLLTTLISLFAFNRNAHANTQDWGINLLPAVTPVQEQVHDFHNLMLVIITGIVVVVTALLLYAAIRYSRFFNKEPAKFTHNTLIEVIWTAIPVLILLVIVVPSFKMLYYMDKTPNPEMTIKTTGYQWYWGYEYVDHDGINFLSYMIPDEDIDVAKGQKRLLSTDTVMVVPVDTNIQLLTTAADVLHAWAMPAFGVKKDAVPGRINETWFRVEKEGTYYGQCSEICGTGHAYMPIEVRAVSKEAFKEWVEKAKKEFASNNLKIEKTISTETSRFALVLDETQATTRIGNTRDAQ